MPGRVWQPPIGGHAARVRALFVSTFGTQPTDLGPSFMRFRLPGLRLPEPMLAFICRRRAGEFVCIRKDGEQDREVLN